MRAAAKKRQPEKEEQEGFDANGGGERRFGDLFRWI